MRSKKLFVLGLLLAALIAAGVLVIASVVPSTPARGNVPDAVLVGAGDVASCTSTGDEATAELLDTLPGTVFVAGDVAYEAGTDAQFTDCYHPSWGRHKARTRPAAGNHEYGTPGASGYFKYFGAAAGDPQKGYYSYDLGAWHIIVINSNCARVGGCKAGSPQEQWLRADLAAHPATCLLAYWHHPLFSSGQHGNFVSMQPIWQALYEAGADVVVSGHDHDYERFAPQDPTGAADPVRGIRQFVVGTGGKNHYGFSTIMPNSEVHNSDTFGVLKLTLHATSYDWQFIPVAGKTFTDAGSGVCHLTNQAAVGATAPDDTAVASVPISGQEVSFPFSDGFESGDLSQWTRVNGLAIQDHEVAHGEYAVRGTSTGSATYTLMEFDNVQQELYYRIRFKIFNQGSSPVYLLRFRTPKGASVLGVYINAAGKLSYRNDIARVSSSSTTDVSRERWHELQVHIRVDGANGQAEVWFDGNRIDALSKTEALGDDMVGAIQLGENANDRDYDVVFDDVVVDTHFVNP
jgi:Calcineurin-like phosphoesterase